LGAVAIATIDNLQRETRSTCERRSIVSWFHGGAKKFAKQGFGDDFNVQIWILGCNNRESYALVLL